MEKILNFLIYTSLGVTIMGFYLFVLIKKKEKKIGLEKSIKIKNGVMFLSINFFLGLLIMVIFLFFVNYFRVLLLEGKISRAHLVIMMTIMTCLVIAIWAKAIKLTANYFGKEKK